MLVGALPGPLGGGPIVPFGEAMVNVTRDQAELKLTEAVRPELDERRHFHVAVIAVPNRL